MTRTEISNRLEFLRGERERLVAQLNIVTGHIAEAEFWLSQAPMDTTELKSKLGADNVELLKGAA